MEPKHLEFKPKPINWGHTCLIGYDRDSLGKETYTYLCECGNRFEQPKASRNWHCGALNCPHLPRRIKQKFLPKSPGRPRALSRSEEALGSTDELSDSAFRKRITFGLSYYQRDRFEEICTLLHISMSSALQEMVDGWCNSHADAAYKNAIRKHLVLNPQTQSKEVASEAYEAIRNKPFSELMGTDENTIYGKRRD